MVGWSLPGAHLWRWLQYYPHHSHQWSGRVSNILEILMKYHPSKNTPFHLYSWRIIQNVIDHKPKPHYFVAVDDSKNTMEDIIKVRFYTFSIFLFRKWTVLMQRGVLLQGSNIRAWTRKNAECFKRGDLSHTGSDGKNQCQLFWYTTVKIINIVQFWFCIDNVFFSSTFYSKQILILCLSTFVLMQHIWKRILTFSGCQKLAWLKTLSRLLKNTSRLGDCWYAEILVFLILPQSWRSELGS